MAHAKVRKLFVLVAALTLLTMSAYQIYSQSAGECIDNAPLLKVGETQELSIDGPTWLRSQVNHQHVYRVEATGSHGAGLEVWHTTFESGSTCYAQIYDQVAAEELSNGSAEIIFTSYWDEAVRLIPANPDTTEDFSVSLEQLAAPPQDAVLIVPAVAHAPGAAGTFFQTDLRTFNPNDWDVDLSFSLISSQGKVASQQTVTVPSEQIVAIDDVVLSQLGLSNATGALQITSDGPLIAISRTYTTDETGSYGQRIAAERWGWSAGVHTYTGDELFLFNIGKSDDYRSNIGFVEVLGMPATIDLEMIDCTGAVIGSGQITLPGNSHRQINDIFDFLAAPARDNVVVRVELSGHARIFGYASKVDNHSEDSIYIPATNDHNSATTIFVPAAAATWGVQSSHWITDLQLLAVDPISLVEVTFLPSDGSEPVTGSFELGTTLLAIDDVVGGLGAGGIGALVVRGYNGNIPGRILVNSRTYNTTAGGTYGQFIPTQQGLVDFGTILGVERSERFRTNIGLMNPNDDTALEVLLNLVGDTGSLLGSKTYQLEPLQHMQLNDIFAALNVPGQSNCRIDVEVIDSWRGVYAYGSVVENESGDPIFVPAANIWSGLNPTSIELLNLDNAFLLDQLPEAAGIDQLPAGTLTASVTGSGNLGRPELPIQVLCMYKSPAGELRSAAVPIGGSITEIGGEQRFWCVIPDWISRQDNTGTVTVTVTGGDQPVTLTLDARDNSVLLDQLTPSVVDSIPAAETYHVEVTGDLGRPELSPQVVVMHRDSVTGQLRVRTAVDGEVIDRVDPEQQMLAVIADWINRDDNTGTTTLSQACTTHSLICDGSVTGALAATDCTQGTLGRGYHAERVTFAGTAGQVVSFIIDFDGYYAYTFLADASGTRIADGTWNEAEELNEIRDVSLLETGEYTLWVANQIYYSERQYTVTASCE